MVRKMRIFDGFDEIKATVGKEIGTSEWVEITQDRINRSRRQPATVDPCRPGESEARAAGRQDHCRWTALAQSGADVYPLGDRPQGLAQHPELWCRSHPLSRARSGRIADQEPHDDCGGRGRAAGRVARDRGRAAPRLCGRADRATLPQAARHASSRDRSDTSLRARRPTPEMPWRTPQAID
jgi:hypothetical protein